MTLRNRIRLFFNPPEGVQDECYTGKWCAVASSWLNRVQERFEHQERRAAAMQMLEEKSAALRGESPGFGQSLTFGPDSLENGQMMTYSAQPRQCSHDLRVAEHVQMCANCWLILKHDARAMVEVERLRSLEKMEEEWNQVALWFRVNKAAEIERGEHAGLSNADAVIRYLSGKK